MDTTGERVAIADILPRGDSNQTSHTVFGKVRNFQRLSNVERAFFITACLNVMGVLVFTSITLGNVAETENEDITYAIIILINTTFCGFFVISGLLREKIFDMVMLIASVTIISTYCTADIIVRVTEGEPISPVKYVRIVLVLLGAVLSIPLAILSMRKFGYVAFNIVGASGELQRLYNNWALFSSLLVIDVQLSVSVVVLVLWQGAKVDTTELITLCVGLPLVVIWSTLGYVMSRLEKTVMMIMFEVVGCLTFAYIGWKSYVIYNHSAGVKCQHSHPNMDTTTTSALNTTTGFFCFHTKLLFATISAEVLYCIVHLMLIVMGVLVLRGFGQGLKDKLKIGDRGVVERIASDNSVES